MHPSRHNTYGGMDQSPFEALFVKPKWGVAVTATATYSRWIDNARVNPNRNAMGHFDEVSDLRSPTCEPGMA